jgi:hypothetical protein
MIARTIALQQKVRGVPEIARLFALVNVALADAGIASWETKYFYQYWRPVTAIRLLRDPNFYPLGGQATQRSAVPCSRSCANFSRMKPHLLLFRMNGTATI